MLTRIRAIADPSEAPDPAYVQGLREAVAVAFDHALAAIETAGENRPPVPVALLAQARLAARNGIALDTVMRRYFAGYSLLGNFILAEASEGALMDGVELQGMLAIHAGLFDRLLHEVSEEHARESARRSASSGWQLAELIERLLAGEPIGTAEIAYDFEGRHLGILAAGTEVKQTIRNFAASLDCRLLLLEREDGALWVWLGARRQIEPADVLDLVASHLAGDQTLAIGEPGEGITGWRLTHGQAVAAHAVARRGLESPVRYADVAMLASMLRDDLLCTSLRELYLAPLAAGRDGGAALRETVRAYCVAERNVSSAASALGVSRRTVANRLRVIEERIGRPLNGALVGIEAAMSLDELDPLL